MLCNAMQQNSQKKNKSKVDDIRQDRVDNTSPKGVRPDQPEQIPVRSILSISQFKRASLTHVPADTQVKSTKGPWMKD